MKNPASQKNGRNRNGTHRKRSFGPIDNFEKHLEADWWKRIFNSMYLKTDSDVVDDKKITESETERKWVFRLLQPFILNPRTMYLR